MPDAACTYMTPPELARERGVSPTKILALIRAGEIAAVNMATNPGGRPRWRIPPEALEAFDSRRMAQPPVKRHRRRRHRGDVIEFF